MINSCPVPSGETLQPAGSRGEGGRRTDAGGERVVQGWARRSIAPPQWWVTADPREGRRGFLESQHTQQSASLSKVPFSPSGKTGKSRLRLKNSETTGAVFLLSAAGTGNHPWVTPEPPPNRRRWKVPILRKHNHHPQLIPLLPPVDTPASTGQRSPTPGRGCAHRAAPALQERR